MIRKTDTEATTAHEPSMSEEKFSASSKLSMISILVEFSSCSNDFNNLEILSFLMLSRLQALFYTLSPGVLTFTAAVHTLEAFVFGFEKMVHGDNTSNGIFLVILLNAFWFISAAIRVDTNSL